MTSVTTDATFTRRQFLVYEAVLSGTPAHLAEKRVDVSALGPAGDDLDERLTWARWNALRASQHPSEPAARG